MKKFILAMCLCLGLLEGETAFGQSANITESGLYNLGFELYDTSSHAYRDRGILQLGQRYNFLLEGLSLPEEVVHNFQITNTFDRLSGAMKVLNQSLIGDLSYQGPLTAIGDPAQFDYYNNIIQNEIFKAQAHEVPEWYGYCHLAATATANPSLNQWLSEIAGYKGLLCGDSYTSLEEIQEFITLFYYNEKNFSRAELGRSAGTKVRHDTSYFASYSGVDDLPPVALHKYLKGLSKDNPIIIEADQGPSIWNYPVQEYEYQVQEFTLKGIIKHLEGAEDEFLNLENEDECFSEAVVKLPFENLVTSDKGMIKYPGFEVDPYKFQLLSIKDLQNQFKSYLLREQVVIPEESKEFDWKGFSQSLDVNFKIDKADPKNTLLADRIKKKMNSCGLRKVETFSLADAFLEFYEKLTLGIQTVPFGEFRTSDAFNEFNQKAYLAEDYLTLTSLGVAEGFGNFYHELGKEIESRVVESFKESEEFRSFLAELPKADKVLAEDPSIPDGRPSLSSEFLELYQNLQESMKSETFARFGQVRFEPFYKRLNTSSLSPSGVYLKFFDFYESLTDAVNSSNVKHLNNYHESENYKKYYNKLLIADQFMSTRKVSVSDEFLEFYEKLLWAEESLKQAIKEDKIVSLYPGMKYKVYNIRLQAVWPSEAYGVVNTDRYVDYDYRFVEVPGDSVGYWWTHYLNRPDMVYKTNKDVRVDNHTNVFVNDLKLLVDTVKDGTLDSLGSEPVCKFIK